LSCSAGYGWAGITSPARHAKLADVTRGRNKVSGAAEAAYLADVALAANFDSLLAAARDAEQAYRQAQAVAAPADQQYELATKLDAALTDAMRSAYAAERAEIGPRGYEDRIYRRKAKARPEVHALTDEAERLLTLRETNQLTGFPARPQTRALGIEVAHLPAH
jgi:hypothetical protein